MLQKSLSPEVLQLRAINAFQEVSNSQGSKLIITNGSTPFLGLPEEMLKK